jgi:hypothetical protein
VDDGANRRFDCEVKTIDERVRGANEFDGERSNRHHVTRLDAMQQHVTENSVLIEFALRQPEGEM